MCNLSYGGHCLFQRPTDWSGSLLIVVVCIGCLASRLNVLQEDHCFLEAYKHLSRLLPAEQLYIPPPESATAFVQKQLMDMAAMVAKAQGKFDLGALEDVVSGVAPEAKGQPEVTSSEKTNDGNLDQKPAYPCLFFLMGSAIAAIKVKGLR